MKYIKITLLMLCLFWGFMTNAQTVGYTYKALAAEGCNMKYSVAKQDTMYSIVATVRSDRMNFLSEPTMKIRTFSGKYLELKGDCDWKWKSVSRYYQRQRSNTCYGDKFYRPVSDYSTTI